jgi:hypothetical protein
MLRVGVLLDRGESSAWIAEILRRVQASGFARVEIALLREHRRGRGDHGWNSALFRRYERWDYQQRATGADPLATVDVRGVLDGVTVSVVSSEEVRTRLCSRELDVILAFTPYEDELGKCSQYGVWSIRQDGDLAYLPGPAGFWPMYDGKPVTETTLVIQNGTGKRAAYGSFASTESTSLYANRSMVYWKAAEIVVRCLGDLHGRGRAFLETLPVEGGARERRADQYPANHQMMRFFSRRLWRSVERRAGLSKQWPQYRWYMALRRRSQERRFDDPSGYVVVSCPKDRFYADPFLIEREGRTFLFFEDFRYETLRACISCCEVRADGATSEPEEVLRQPFHLSYPFVFEDGGEMYMVPESRGNRRVELYRATDFPRGWAPERVLLNDIDAVDATIYKTQGKYWMFAGVSDGRFSACDELSLFYADTLQGPWKAHPKNPLISDVRRARPAGALFWHEGRLIRPSQDSSKTYGYGLVFSEVVTLSETEYEERVIGSLYPESIRGCTANHTYNRSDQFEVIDRFLSKDV